MCHDWCARTTHKEANMNMKMPQYCLYSQSCAFEEHLDGIGVQGQLFANNCTVKCTIFSSS